MLIKPDPGRSAEQDPPGLGIYEGTGTLVVLDLEREVLGLAQVVAEGLLADGSTGRQSCGSGPPTGAGSRPSLRSCNA